MKNSSKIIIALVVIIAIVAIVAVIMMNNNGKNEKSSLKISSSEDLTKLIEDIYEKKEKPFPSLETTEIDVSDETMVSSVTGLEDGDKLEYLVVSEPMISSQAYSFVLAKVKSGVNSDSIAKEMFDNINPRKWICVSAEKVCATSSGDVACLIMTNKENTDDIFEGFKEVAGNVGKEYTKDVQEEGLPDDMMFPGIEIPSDLDEPVYSEDEELDSYEDTDSNVNEGDSEISTGVLEPDGVSISVE